jgi:hypothetical protein
MPTTGEGERLLNHAKGIVAEMRSYFVRVESDFRPDSSTLSFRWNEWPAPEVPKRVPCGKRRHAARTHW